MVHDNTQEVGSVMSDIYHSQISSLLPLGADGTPTPTSYTDF